MGERTDRPQGLTDREWLVRGAAGIAVYFLLAMAPVLLMLVGHGRPPRTMLREFSVAIAFAGLSVMGLQLLLAARFKALKAPYGIDAVYHFHREVSLVALGLVALHPVLLVIDDPATLELFRFFSAPVRARFALLSLAATVLVVVLSYFRGRLRLDYETWRRSHGALAVVLLAAAVVHVELVGYYVSTPAKRVLWLLYPTVWVLVLGWTRIARPYLMLRRPWRVAQVREERGRAWTLRLEPSHAAPFSFDPGQFVWLHLRHSPFAMAEHPFSISSSAQDSSAIEVTVKELGDFTARIGDVTLGELAYVDGPYGQFSVDRHRARAYGFIVGGVGITPVMSMLRTMAARRDTRPLVLLYAASSLEEMTFREEIETLAAGVLNLDFVAVPARPEPGWTGASGFVTQELIERTFGPGRTEFEYFVCGPEPMMRAVSVALGASGVHASQIRYELFGLV